MTKSTVTSNEVTETQKLAHLAIALVDGREAHIALGGLMMATAMYAQFIRIPLESVSAVFDHGLEETYSILGKDKT